MSEACSMGIDFVRRIACDCDICHFLDLAVSFRMIRNWLWGHMMAEDKRKTGTNWWKFIAVGLGAIAVLVLLVFVGYQISWTGFGESQEVVTTTRTEISGGVETVTEIVETRSSPAKTLWDWLGLLIVPVMLAGGAAWIAYSQQNRELEERENDRLIANEARDVELKIAEETRDTDLEIAKDRQEQITLESYYDRMADLLLSHDLRKTNDDDEERSIARNRTLTVFRSLNGTRKGQIVRFLYESKLIDCPAPVIVLRGANLRSAYLGDASLAGADLSGVDLGGANLSRADLSRTNLRESRLSGANIHNAEFIDADLSESSLRRANLNGADLGRANLSGADLSGASLEFTNLSQVNLSLAELRMTKPLWTLLDSARYTVDTRWPDGFDAKAAGAILLEEDGDRNKD